MNEEHKAHIASMFNMIASAFEHMVDTMPQAAGLARLSRDIKAAAQYLIDMGTPPPKDDEGKPPFKDDEGKNPAAPAKSDDKKK